MNIISKRIIVEFCKIHAEPKDQLVSLYRTLERGSYANINELKDAFSMVSVLNDGRAVFNIKGNKYRVVIAFNFGRQKGFVRFIGTHAEYDLIDANKI